ncbi:MAG: hypothetical protein O3C43_14870 [Verrucomicrobia bacterium]|nr:hypothetical protein [Verrucomicrobiota bacterium]
MTITNIRKHTPEINRVQKSGEQNPYTGLAQIAKQVPSFIRLPKSGQQCPHSGYTRSGLNELILPTAENPNPPVRSVLIRKRGAMRGVRLIVYDSLMNYLNSFDAHGEKVVEEVAL